AIKQGPETKNYRKVVIRNIPFKTKGLSDPFTYGRGLINVEGVLIFNQNDKIWEFWGRLAPNSVNAGDVYNFNKSNRDIIKEGITTLGRKTPGIDYKIIFKPDYNPNLDLFAKGKY